MLHGDTNLLGNSQQTSLNRLQAGLHQHTIIPAACLSAPLCRLRKGQAVIRRSSTHWMAVTDSAACLAACSIVRSMLGWRFRKRPRFTLVVLVSETFES